MKLSHVFNAFVVYVGCTILDDVSSMGHFPPGSIETNPFERHANGVFWPAHALIDNSLNTLHFAGLAILLYIAAVPLSKTLAKTLAALPFLYYGAAHISAAIDNFRIQWPGLMVFIDK